MQTIGVIADTHIPDRTRFLPQKVLDIFQDAKVSRIMHAGDISLKRVLTQLEEVAPVHAVRGNRDLFLGKNIPRYQLLEIEQIRIGLSHGHGSWAEYLIDKARYLLRGPGSFKEVEDRVLRHFPQTKVILFGHTHTPVSRVLVNGQPWIAKFPK